MKQLGAGQASTVFDLGDGRVLRHGGSPEREAAIMEHPRRAGYPVPAVHEVRPDALVLERIEGPTMMADLRRRPWRLTARMRGCWRSCMTVCTRSRSRRPPSCTSTYTRSTCSSRPPGPS